MTPKQRKRLDALEGRHGLPAARDLANTMRRIADREPRAPRKRPAIGPAIFLALLMWLCIFAFFWV